MSRVPRSIIPGLVYHLISRFVDREWFITHERERAHYLELLGNAVRKSDWRCLGYCVMSNHIHIPVVAGKHSLSSWIRRVHSPFADFMNKEHDRIGPLFVRGPRALETPSPEVRRLLAYVHNNPVRAKVVAKPADSRWTSHRAYLGLERPPAWLDVQLGLQLCGFADPRSFDEFVTLHANDPAREALEPGAIESDMTPPFREAIEMRQRKSERPSASAVVEATASVLGISLASLCSARRADALGFAREVAVHCASVVGITGVAIADALQLSQSGASRALARAVERPDVLVVAERVVQRLRDGATHTTHA
jgi:REP element-mobilizing transposase RayT